MGRLAVRLYGDADGTALAQHLAHQAEALGETGAHDDAVRAGEDAARPRQIVRERLAELDSATRVAVAERAPRDRRERPSHRADPGCGRERGQIGHAGPKVVARPPRRGRLADRAGTVARTSGDPGARALTGGQPALGHQLAVRLGDRVAGQAQVAGELSRRRQPDARHQAAGAHRVAQGRLQTGPDPGRRDVQVQIDAGNGPCSYHVNGPYSWAVWPLTSMA
jgi:hypothetical protein